jgi:GTPase SAR1 family protein
MTSLAPSASYKQLIIGLPEAGKTTFLAALWHVVVSKEVPGSLRLLKLEGDRKHLNKIRRAWLEFRKVGRTVPGTEQLVSMKLGLPDGGESTELVFPDMSGESFRQQWVNRKWTKEYDELVRESNGILLFVHSRKVVGPDRIDPDVEEAVSALGDEADMEDEAAAVDDEDLLPEWDPKKSPTGVQLVELIQFIEQQPHLGNIRRVAVIVSAWDMAMKSYKSPEEWLSKRLPLLDQYLKANYERFPSRIYGISAQGAPLDGDLTRLKQYEHQSERIIIVGEECAPHDITAPVKWVMGGV